MSKPFEKSLGKTLKSKGNTISKTLGENLAKYSAKEIGAAANYSYSVPKNY
jgi:hypothetical protein